MKTAIDTNVLAYAEGLNGTVRQPQALRIVGRLPLEETIIPVQALGELFNVLVRKGGRTRERARGAVEFWRNASRVVNTTADLMQDAMGLASQHRIAIWDAVVLAAATSASCPVLLSEDMQDGFVWQGVTVCNPFASKPHPLIADLVRT